MLYISVAGTMSAAAPDLRGIANRGSSTTLSLLLPFIRNKRHRELQKREQREKAGVLADTS
jgi:superfamily II DNA/RNA helicase